MSAIPIALALRKSRLARLAVLPALAMLAFACVNEQPAPTPRSDASAIAAEATNVAVTSIPRNDASAAVSPTPQVAADSQEPPTATPASSEENPHKVDLKEIEMMLTHVSYAPDSGFVSLDERILRSTVIARATMRSVEAHARGYYTPTTYYPIIRFTFDVHEYLKGSSGDVITADIQIACTEYTQGRCLSSSEQEAVDYANAWIDLSNLANRWWEDRESIIFLEEDKLGRSEASVQAASTMYKFIPWDEYRIPIHDYAATNQYPYSYTDGYSVRSERNRVWLPATADSSSASGASESRFMLGNRPKKDLYSEPGVLKSSWFAFDISLSDLKSRIKAVADMVKQGEGVSGYEECLRQKYGAFRSPRGPDTREFQVRVALWAGRVVDSIFYAGDEYDIFFLEGDDKRFFEFDIKDADDDPFNGYISRLKTTRPLVRGDYSVMYHRMPGSIRPCIDASAGGRRDVPVANVTWTIRVTDPGKTLHEAFFDPVAIGAAVGADSANGILTPAEFPTTSGADAQIRRIDWASDVVNIEIANPPASLADHHIDFIALDGATTLRLAFGDAAIADAGAVRTFSWGVCGPPWQAGDKLMLRIRESAPGLAGAARQGACADAPMPTQTLSPSATR